MQYRTSEYKQSSEAVNSKEAMHSQEVENSISKLEHCHSLQFLEKQVLDPAKIPNHVAIIMDGNRRWAKQHGMLPIMGHFYGSETLQEITEIAADLGIKALTVYSFSTENWKRSTEEVQSLFALFTHVLRQKCQRMVEKGIRLNTIGDISRLPDHLQEAIAETKAATSKCTKIDLVLALNYGGRDDIKRAVLNIMDDYGSGKIKKEAVTETFFSTYLDTAAWQDPDLVIRTSGEMRLSNFLLWQICYSEIHVTDVLWPDFSKEHLVAALLDYQKRDRRMGQR
ncbi:MAG: uppS [Chlamydiales bacterium]|jgi:undecaprenyl diphosphate synthase|nr:uppS [Chlamydiales bacterium]